MTDGMSEQEAITSLEDHGLLCEGDADIQLASESLQKLFDLVDRDVIAWRPMVGDKVGGTLRDISESSEGEFGKYLILMVETPSGRLVNVHCFHTVLRNEVERKIKRGYLATGDEIAIAYLGEKPSSSGRSDVHMYRVVSHRP